jgi:ribonuclease III
MPSPASEPAPYRYIPRGRASGYLLPAAAGTATLDVDGTGGEKPHNFKGSAPTRGPTDSQARRQFGLTPSPGCTRRVTASAQGSGARRGAAARSRHPVRERYPPARGPDPPLVFLGDAVLGLITTDYLFQRFPKLGEGELTNLRSALVRTETLARFSHEIKLGQYLFLGRGEEISHGRQRPAGLACAFEALLGSIYLDQGYECARDFAMRFVEPELSTVLEGRTHRNAKSMLQELVQARLQQTPTYHLVQESGPDHAKAFTVEVRVGSRILGRGRDRSKRGAEQAAAESALTQLRNAASLEASG